MIFHGVPLECINQSAEMFHVPAKLIISVIKIENGWNGATVKNKNGSEDLGVMQVNTTWLKELSRYGISRENLQYDPCVNVHTGTWLLAKGLARGEGWQGVGNYHSATPIYNTAYRQKVKKAYEGMQRALGEDERV